MEPPPPPPPKCRASTWRVLTSCSRAHAKYPPVHYGVDWFVLGAWDNLTLSQAYRKHLDSYTTHNDSHLESKERRATPIGWRVPVARTRHWFVSCRRDTKVRSSNCSTISLDMRRCFIQHMHKLHAQFCEEVINLLQIYSIFTFVS